MSGPTTSIHNIILDKTTSSSSDALEASLIVGGTHPSMYRAKFAAIELKGSHSLGIDTSVVCRDLPASREAFRHDLCEPRQRGLGFPASSSTPPYARFPVNSIVHTRVAAGHSPSCPVIMVAVT